MWSSAAFAIISKRISKKQSFKLFRGNLQVWGRNKVTVKWRQANVFLRLRTLSCSRIFAVWNTVESRQKQCSNYHNLRSFLTNQHSISAKPIEKTGTVLDRLHHCITSYLVVDLCWYLPCKPHPVSFLHRHGALNSKKWLGSRRTFLRKRLLEREHFCWFVLLLSLLWHHVAKQLVRHERYKSSNHLGVSPLRKKMEWSTRFHTRTTNNCLRKLKHDRWF